MPLAKPDLYRWPGPGRGGRWPAKPPQCPGSAKPALAQFTAALTSANSRYDKHVRHEAGGALTTPERRGQALFQTKCSGCHATDLFTDESFRNNGLDCIFARNSGRAHITARPTDQGRFKVLSLRNVARTALYMHDSRFKTLENVLDRYSDHVQMNSPNLDPNLAAPAGINDPPFGTHVDLTATEKKQVIAFLETLTDSTFIKEAVRKFILTQANTSLLLYCIL